MLVACEICGHDFEGEVKTCCSGRDCGCMGLPIEPILCSDKCANEWYERIKIRQTVKEFNIL